MYCDELHTAAARETLKNLLRHYPRRWNIVWWDCSCAKIAPMVGARGAGPFSDKGINELLFGRVQALYAPQPSKRV